MEQSRYRASLNSRQSWGGRVVGVSQGLQDRVLGWKPELKSRLVIPGVADQLTREFIDKVRVNIGDKSDVLRLRNATFISSDKMTELTDGCNESEFIEYLVASRQLVEFSVDGVNFYKISSGPGVVVFDPVVDVGIMKLDLALSDIDSKVDEGEDEIKSLESRAKDLLKSGSRMSAKAVLRRKKMVENKVESLLGQKLNTESLLDKIRSAESDKSVIEAYKSGYQALAVGLKDVDIGDVEELQDNLTDVVGKADSVAEMLANNQLDNTGDTEDLERELMDLSSEENVTNKSLEDKQLLDELDKLALEEGSFSPEKKLKDKKRSMESTDN